MLKSLQKRKKKRERNKRLTEVSHQSISFLALSSRVYEGASVEEWEKRKGKEMRSTSLSRWLVVYFVLKSLGRVTMWEVQLNGGFPKKVEEGERPGNASASLGDLDDSRLLRCSTPPGRET